MSPEAQILLYRIIDGLSLICICCVDAFAWPVMIDSAAITTCPAFELIILMVGKWKMLAVFFAASDQKTLFSSVCWLEMRLTSFTSLQVYCSSLSDHLMAGFLSESIPIDNYCNFTAKINMYSKQPL